MCVKNCWLCENYKEIEISTRKINRLVRDDEYSYVIVPKDSHKLHHLIIALKEHKEGFINLSAEDHAHIGKIFEETCCTFKNLGYNRVYAGCYSDEGHIHYHLIPFIKNIDKLYCGYAMHWLAEMERTTNLNPFDGMSIIAQTKRLDQIEIEVAEICAKWPK